MDDAVPTLRISTDGLPERERAPVWRELYGREVLRLEVEPLGDAPFCSNVTARMLPGLGIITGRSTAFRVARTRALLTDGNDNFIFQMSSGPGLASQLGRDVEVSANDAIMLSNADVGTFTYPAHPDIRVLSLSRNVIAPLLRDPDVLVRAVPGQSAAMRLLSKYLKILDDEEATATPELQHLAVMHVYDLVALALGAKRDVAYVAESRGVRATRLRTIKDDVLANLLSPGLSVTVVAQRHRVSPRYVQQLFDTERTTFTEFVRENRLTHSHLMLTSPRFRTTPISTIAYDCGFGDLSYFNRAFHRRFGMSPSDVRAGARRLGCRP